MPGIVSDVDGVVLNGKQPTPGANEALTQLLLPWQNTQRRMPFLFLTNGGGMSEATKAVSLNKPIGLSGDARITGKEVILCHTIFYSPHFQDRFADKWVLVDGIAPDEVKLAMSYGFKKVISLKELMSLSFWLSSLAFFDFYESME